MFLCINIVHESCSHITQVHGVCSYYYSTCTMEPSGHVGDNINSAVLSFVESEVVLFQRFKMD